MEQQHQHQHYHHHHHHSDRRDDAEVFKNKNLRASRRRKLFARVLYYTMVAMAIAVSLAVFYLYYIE